MIKELSEVKIMRKKLEMTQTELAKKAKVSQSLIAKIEAGKLDPSFSFAKKIFEVLNNIKESKELQAYQIMHDKIIYVKPDDKLSDAIIKMKKYEISQMPVIDNGKSVGLISDSLILDAFTLNKQELNVKDIMVDSSPTVSKNTSIEIIINMLTFFPLILVGDKGKLIGVIAKSDVLNKFYN